MKTLLLLIGLLFLPMQVNSFETKVEKITVMQINARWNEKNNIDLDDLTGCDVKFAWLNDQPKSFKETIKTVPVILVFNGNKSVMQWSAGLSFELEIDLNEIQKIVNSIK